MAEEEEKPKAETKTAVAKSDPPAESTPEEKPSKSVEWGIAIAMMVVLIGFLFMMIHLMRSARSAVM